MKKILLPLLAFLFISPVFSQIQNPVKWVFSSQKTGRGVYEIHCTATLDKGWHTYSQKTPDGGPIPTVIGFNKNPLVTLEGAVKEIGNMQKHSEPLFGVEVWQFSAKVDFVQKVVLKANIKTTIDGSIKFMTCNDQECMPPALRNFSVTLR